MKLHSLKTYTTLRLNWKKALLIKKACNYFIFSIFFFFFFFQFTNIVYNVDLMYQLSKCPYSYFSKTMEFYLRALFLWVSLSTSAKTFSNSISTLLHLRKTQNVLQFPLIFFISFFFLYLLEKLNALHLSLFSIFFFFTTAFPECRRIRSILFLMKKRSWSNCV